MKRKVKRPFDNEQFRKGYVAGMFAAEKELNTELLHFAEKAHKIMSEGTFPDYGIKINFKDANNTIATNLDMKTEEKAKRYDEALNWMRELYPGLNGATKEDAEHYFPELAESEDEKIRKDVLAFIKHEGQHIDKYKWPKWIAWLEKQKEQPKEELVYRMNGLMQEYIKEGEDDAEKEHRFKCYQLFWDALEDADFFEQKEQKPVDDKAFEEWIDGWYNEHHRDGYITMDEREFKNFCRGIRNMYQQKPVEWSEEDKAMIDDIIFSLPRMANGSIEMLPSVAKSYSERLKSLCPQPKQEWSEEDEEMIEGIIGDLCALKDWIIKYDTNWLANPVLKNIDKRIAWLKSLKDRGNFPKSNTNFPSEWSEEDEKLRKNIIWLLEIHPSYRKEVDWLKSLSSHSHWKPSEEQMKALCETIAFAPDTFKPKCTLVTLQDDLKKLMEE